MKKQKGFTLIELLVVIAIIGILSSVVLASLSTARAKSRDARRISDIGQLQLSLEMYFDTQATYPTSTAGTFSATVNIVDSTKPINYLVVAGFLPKLPAEPNTTGKYWYGALASNTATDFTTATPVTSYVLAALLERTDNTALTSDADKDVGTIFHGGNADCAATANGAAGTEKCYDIIP